MSSRFDEIRSALDRGFSVENLRTITNLALDLLQKNNLKHPAVFQAIACASRWVADSWDGVALEVSVATRVEGELMSSLIFLVENAEEDNSLVCSALDNLARAFREAIRCGLDTDL